MHVVVDHGFDKCVDLYIGMRIDVVVGKKKKRTRLYLSNKWPLKK